MAAWNQWPLIQDFGSTIIGSRGTVQISDQKVGRSLGQRPKAGHWDSCCVFSLTWIMLKQNKGVGCWLEHKALPYSTIAFPRALPTSGLESWMRVLCFESRFKPANTRTHQPTCQPLLKARKPTKCMYNSATASKSAFWIPGSSMSNLRNQWIRIQHFCWITEYSGLWYHDKKTSPHFQHMKAPSPELYFATVPKVSEALELLACSVQISLPPRPVEEDIQVFGLGQGLLSKHELPNNFPICVVWLRRLCGMMIHNKNNDIDGMIFVRLFQRHAGKACQSCRIKHGIITSKIVAQVGHMMQARATAAAVCSDNVRVGVLPVAMQQTTV